MSNSGVGHTARVQLRGSHSVVIPSEIAEYYKQKGQDRIKCLATLRDKELEFHAALRKYQGRYIISFGKRYQKELGLNSEDEFTLTFSEDDSKYGVDMPEEFEAVLASDPEANEIFESFSDGKKRSLIYFVLRVKSSQTRIDKSLMVAENMKMGIQKTQDLLKDHR